MKIDIRDDQTVFRVGDDDNGIYVSGGVEPGIVTLHIGKLEITMTQKQEEVIMDYYVNILD